MVEIALPDYLDEINALIDDGRPGEAIIHARHILEQYPTQIDVYRLLAKALLDQGEFADAEDLFQRVLSAYPDDFISHAGLAIVRKEEGKTKESLWYMERAFEIEPYNAAIREELNDLYGRRDGLPPEQLTLNRAALARLYVKGEIYQQAVAELQNLLGEGVRRVDLQVLLAEALWRAGRRVEAVDTCLQVLGQLPNCVQACAIVAEVWLSTGRVEEAQPYLKRLQALTQLSQADLSGDGPIVLAFQAEGAYPLPERLMLERLPEQAALGIVEGEAAEWVDEVSFVEGEDDFDWLRALEGDEQEGAEEPVVAGEEAEEGEEEEEGEDEDEDDELLGWLRDVVAYDEEAAADEVGEPLPEQPGESAADDSVGWLADIDEMAIEDASLEDAFVEDTAAENAGTETPAEPGQEEPFAEEGWGEDAEAEPTGDWSEVFDEEDADLAGASAWLSEAGDEMEEMVGDETDWEEWLEAGTLADEAGEIPGWLADRRDPGDPETGVAGEDEQSLPDWPGEGAGAEPSGEETTETTSGIEAESMMPDDEFDLEEVSMGTSEEPRKERPEEETPETEGQESPEATTPEEDLDWLKDLGEVAAEETGPPAGDEGAEPTAAGDLPDWLHEDMDAEAGLDDSLEWLDDEEVDGPAEAGEEGVDVAGGAQSDRDEASSEAEAASEEEGASEEEDLSWLDQIAAGEGEPLEEPPTFSWPEDDEEDAEVEQPAGAVARDEAPEDLDEAMVWLEQLAAQQGAPLDELPSVEQFADEDTGVDELFAGMPDDPAEAMAWLEGLADEQEEPAEAEFEATQPESEEETIPATEFHEPEGEEDLDWLDDLGAGEEVEPEGLTAGVEEEPVAAGEEEEEAELADAEFAVEGEETALDWLDDLGAGEEEEEPEWLGEIVEEAPVAFEEEEIAAEPATPVEFEGEEDEVELDWLDDLDAGEEEEEPAWSGEAEAEEEVLVEEPGMPAELEAEADEAELDWLDEVDRDEEPAEAEAGEGGVEVTAVPAGELPDWLTDMEPSEEEQPEAEVEDSALRALPVSAEGVDVEEEEIGEEQIDEAIDHFFAEEGDEGAAEPEWLDDLGDEESVPELAAEDQALGAEMAAAGQDDDMRAWLEEVAADEGMDELLADLPEDKDEALAYLEELATQFEAEEMAPPERPQAEPAGLEPAEDLAWMETLAEAADEPELESAAGVSETAATGGEDDVPEDLEEAMAWLEKLAAEQGAPMDELPSLQESEMMPAGPQTDLEAGEEEPAAEEEVAAGAEAETYVETGEEMEPEPAGAPDEGAGLPVEDADEAMAWLERLAGQEAEADEKAEPAAPLPDLSDEIPDDPEEALAWLEQLAGRPDTTVSDEPAYAEDAAEVVEEPITPAMAQDIVAAETEAEALQREEEEVPSEAEDAGETALEEEMLEEIPEDPDEAMAWLEQLAARQGASLDELPYVQEVAEEVETPEWLAREAAEEEAAQAEAAQAEAARAEAAPEEIVPSEAQVEEAVPEQVVPEETEEIEADEDLDWLDEVAGVKATGPVDEGETPAEPPAVAAAAEKEEEPEAFDFDLPDLDEESLPDWLAFDEEGETAEFEWDEAAADVTGWLTAEEEVTRHGPEEEPLPERALRPPEQEGRPEPAPPAGEAVPAPLPAVPAGLDLDEETLEAAREAVNADDYDTAVSAYQSLLDSGRGLSLVIADLETAVARAGQQALLRRLLGDAYMRNGQLQKALESYRQALELL